MLLLGETFLKPRISVFTENMKHQGRLNWVQKSQTQFFFPSSPGKVLMSGCEKKRACWCILEAEGLSKNRSLKSQRKGGVADKQEQRPHKARQKGHMPVSSLLRVHRTSRASLGISPMTLQDISTYVSIYRSPLDIQEFYTHSYLNFMLLSI